MFFCNGSVSFRNGIERIARKVSDGIGADGVRAKFPFLQFSPWPKTKDNRQQLPGNVQKTLNSAEAKN